MKTSRKTASKGDAKKAEAGRGDHSGPQTAKASGGLWEWIKSILWAVVIFLVVRSFVLETFSIISGSMEQTLLVGDLVVVNRLALGSPVPFLGFRVPGYSEPHRGDVMVFDPPPPDDIGMKVVKRVMGLPGDTLEMRGGVLYVDGRAQVEPYVVHTDLPDVTDPWMSWQRKYLTAGVDPETYAPTRDDWGPLVIPAGSYFMMGDNRENSVDSRFWGLVERWRLEGRPVFVYFSYNRDSYRPFPWLREIRWGRLGPFHDGYPATAVGGG